MLDGDTHLLDVSWVTVGNGTKEIDPLMQPSAGCGDVAAYAAASTVSALPRQNCPYTNASGPTGIRLPYVPALNSIRRFRARPSAVSFGATG